jgi:hypothetical protein
MGVVEEEGEVVAAASNLTHRAHQLGGVELVHHHQVRAAGELVHPFDQTVPVGMVSARDALRALLEEGEEDA